MLALLLASALCVASSLPPPDQRTPEFWDRYLTNLLHDCYGHMAPIVADTPAAVSSLPTMALSLFQVSDGRLTSAVLVEPAFLQWAPSPAHIAVIVGHEATHVALFGRPGMENMPHDREEFICDMVAASAMPLGACFLADVYEWHIARSQPVGDPDLTARLANLHPLCTAQRALQ